MPLYTKESLENLRQKVDLLEVVQPYVELKRAGASYKGLCPFHDERTPSFTVNKGDSHYHCFGCGAHGDSIQFLIEHQRLGFQQAVEHLAQRFNITLEVVEEKGESHGPKKTDLKAALEQATKLYHCLLLHTEEGHQALHYLYSRGLDLEFIRHFQLGWALRASGLMHKVLQSKGVHEEILVASGLLSVREDGSKREFFQDRILFPIRDAMGAVIGFSARKIREETFGGKYINTSETPLFKKSRVLFGLNYSRKRIAKEQQAIVVEGQIDALRLIHEGLNLVVAGQGTAFGEGHVSELTNLGVKRVYLALDADRAGQEATRKIGNLFQREGVEVTVVPLPRGDDPDSLVRAKGIAHFISLLEGGHDYLTFLINSYGRERDMTSPAGKTQIVQEIVAQIRSWTHPVMIHESLRKLAQLAQVPEQMVGVGVDVSPNYIVRHTATAGLLEIDPDRILEMDLLRWLLISGEQRMSFISLASHYLKPEDLRVDICAKITRILFKASQHQRKIDMLSLMTEVDDPACQLLLEELVQKRIKKERGAEHLLETIQRILDRNWMEQCETLRMKIQSGGCNDDEVLILAKEFDRLKRNPQKISKEAWVSASAS